MSEKVILDEGGSICVHTRIKDMCKAARNQKGLTNQDICNLISERFGLPDFSINTVTNFFSDRSKATTIYTTGYICAVLDISIDAAFGMVGNLSDAEQRELSRQLVDVKAELRVREQEVASLHTQMQEKDIRIQEVHEELDFLRKEAERNQKKVQPWVFIITVSLLILCIAFIAFYLLFFDVRNPQYGLFRSMTTQEGIASKVLFPFLGIRI